MMSVSEPTATAGLRPVKVSVCIPTYNGQDFVREAVESVLSQTYKDFELLLVDDNSTDNTPDILRSFSDSRVRVCLNSERRGIPGNWNRCLSLAGGEYVCLFHQDDLMLPENLEKKVWVLDSDPQVSFVHSSAEVLVEESAPPLLAAWSGAEDYIVEGADYFRRLLFHGNTICCPSVMVRRQRLLDAGGFDETLKYACDYEAWMRLSVEGRIAFLKQPLVSYRWHRQNASHTFQEMKGTEEVITACERVVPRYLERTGRWHEKTILEEALGSLAASRRWAGQLQQDLPALKGWIEELEKAKAWLIEQWKQDQARLQSRDLELQTLTLRLQECDHQLQTLLASRSWRWMCAIRAMVPFPRRRRAG
ncbi:MAG TPA: glycosyltransferase [Gemmataceae bacterium]|jgi:glycosyltransferase involved in cell wall biosynthesis